MLEHQVLELTLSLDSGESYVPNLPPATPTQDRLPIGCDTQYVDSITKLTSSSVVSLHLSRPNCLLYHYILLYIQLFDTHLVSQRVSIDPPQERCDGYGVAVAAIVERIDPPDGEKGSSRVRMQNTDVVQPVWQSDIPRLCR